MYTYVRACEIDLKKCKIKMGVIQKRIKYREDFFVSLKAIEIKGFLI